MTWLEVRLEGEGNIDMVAVGSQWSISQVQFRRA